MIEGLTNGDALPVLERLLQFSGARHRVLSHNVVNADTPGFRMLDLSVEQFQQSLREAIDARREAHGAAGGALATEPASSGAVLEPTELGTGLLYHDRGDRDPERLMQDLVENFYVFRAAADLLRSRIGLIEAAIRERP